MEVVRMWTGHLVRRGWRATVFLVLLAGEWIDANSPETFPDPYVVQLDENADASASGNVAHAVHIGGTPEMTVTPREVIVSNAVDGSNRSTSTTDAPA